MPNDWLTLVFTFIPQMGGAVLFFWLCQKNADRQREAYQDQIGKLYDMMSTMLEVNGRQLSRLTELTNVMLKE